MITVIKKLTVESIGLSDVKIGDTFRLASGCGDLYIKIVGRGNNSLCYSFHANEETAVLNSERCILVDCEVHWRDRR